MRPIMDPRLDNHDARITDHAFEPFPFAWPTCSRVEVTNGVGRSCDRPEHEHAPATEEVEAGA